MKTTDNESGCWTGRGHTVIISLRDKKKRLVVAHCTPYIQVPGGPVDGWLSTV